MRHALAAALALLVTAQSTPAPYDLVLKNGRIVDGTGSPWFTRRRRDSRATRSRASRRRLRSPRPAYRRQRRVVAPGFIDIHTHARRGIFEVPTADNYVRQGVTTVIEGPDGVVAPCRWALSWTSSRRCSGRSTSAASSVRARSASAVVGAVNRTATPDEVQQDDRARRAGHARRRVRPEHGTVLRARHVHADRGSDRARESRRPRIGGVHDVAHARRRGEACSTA